MDARDGDAKPCAALLHACRLRSGTGDHNGVVARERGAKRPASWNGRAVIVGITATTVILAVVSVVVPGLRR